MTEVGSTGNVEGGRWADLFWSAEACFSFWWSELVLACF